jgi:uncharacterized protein DUF932
MENNNTIQVNVQSVIRGDLWHGTRHVTLKPNMTMEEIKDELKIEDYAKARVFLRAEDGTVFEDTSVCGIYRPSDKRVYQYPASTYQIHQAGDVLAFYKNFAIAGQVSLENLLYLNQGARFCATYKTGESFTVGTGDKVEAYLIGSTTFDGTGATLFSPGSFCVVCPNTEAHWRDDAKGNKRAIRIRHTTELTPEVIAEAQKVMGLAKEEFAQYQEFASLSSALKIPASIGPTMFAHYLSSITEQTEGKRNKASRNLRDRVDTQSAKYDVSKGAALLQIMTEVASSDKVDIMRLADEQQYDSNNLSRRGASILESILSGPGQDVDSRLNTAWGLHNGVTYYVDNKMGRERDTALASAWFGTGATLKDTSHALVAEMVA